MIFIIIPCFIINTIVILMSFRLLLIPLCGAGASGQTTASRFWHYRNCRGAIATSGSRLEIRPSEPWPRHLLAFTRPEERRVCKKGFALKSCRRETCRMIHVYQEGINSKGPRRDQWQGQCNWYIVSYLIQVGIIINIG